MRLKALNILDQISNIEFINYITSQNPFNFSLINLNFYFFAVLFNVFIIIFIIAIAISVSVILYFIFKKKFQFEEGINSNPLYSADEKIQKINDNKKNCYNCNKLIDKKDKYCLYCGANLKKEKNKIKYRIKVEKYNKLLEDAKNLFKERYYSSVVFKCGRQIIQTLLYDIIKDDEDYEIWYKENPSDNLDSDTFLTRIEYLFSKKVIGQEYRNKLHFIRKKSNITSHPEESEIEIKERMTVKVLEYTSDFLEFILKHEKLSEC